MDFWDVLYWNLHGSGTCNICTTWRAPSPRGGGGGACSLQPAARGAPASGTAEEISQVTIAVVGVDPAACNARSTYRRMCARFRSSLPGSGVSQLHLCTNTKVITVAVKSCIFEIAFSCQNTPQDGRACDWTRVAWTVSTQFKVKQQLLEERTLHEVLILTKKKQHSHLFLAPFTKCFHLKCTLTSFRL